MRKPNKANRNVSKTKLNNNILVILTTYSQTMNWFYFTHLVVTNSTTADKKVSGTTLF